MSSLKSYSSFKSISGFGGAGIELNNGSVIMDEKTSCTRKANLTCQTGKKKQNHIPRVGK